MDKEKKQTFKESKKEMLKRKFNDRKVLLVILIAVAMFLLGFGGWSIYHVFTKEPLMPIMDQSAEVVLASSDNCPENTESRKLDGICVDKDKVNLPIYTFMIENSYEARPQSSLSKANLVYEAIAEGGITRFMVVYDSDQDLSRIGPVRSARTYFLDWAQEVGDVYVHIGGSPEALELVKTRPIYDLDQFFNGPFFWRDSLKAAPHNVYTSIDLISKAIASKEWLLTTEYDTWNFANDAELSGRGDISVIDVDYGSSYYSVKWKYDKEKNEYLRLQGSYSHKDEEGEQVVAKNIAVMYSKSYVIAGDDKARRYTQTVGEGQAYVFQNGQAIVGTWKREDLNSRTRFYDENGQEITFVRGLTWVQALPNDFPDVVYE